MVISTRVGYFFGCLIGVATAFMLNNQPEVDGLHWSLPTRRHGRRLASDEIIGCPPISVMDSSVSSVSLLAGGEPSFSMLASNISCFWAIPSMGNVFSIGVSFVRLPPGAMITIEAFPGEYVAESECTCEDNNEPVCADGISYRNNCTALCSGVPLGHLRNCARMRTVIQGDVPIPLEVPSEGGAFTVRFDALGPSDTPPSPYVQMGFHLEMIFAPTCFNDCSNHGECTHPDSGPAECVCEDEWHGADCSVRIPVIHDGESIAVKSLCPGCWFFAQFSIVNTSFIGVEVDSTTDSESDPFVVASRYLTPALNRFDRGQSWVSWTYEDSQLRLVSWDVPLTAEVDGPYYIGVVNHPLRAKEPIDFVVTLRLGNDTYRPCIHDCSGNGVCDYRAPQATCDCSKGSTGVYCEQNDYEIEFGHPPFGVSIPLRMGQWAFWHFDIPVNKAFSSTVMISFQSLSPRAYPFVGVRRNQVPVLDSRFLPTFDAFMVDFADNAGFDLLKGQRQTIIIPSQNLSAGRYYIGVFNLWGRTGLPQTSRSSLNYTLFVDAYKAAIPCPMERGTFCGEITPRSKCDISNGVCNCAIDELGNGCYFKAKPLPFGSPSPPSKIVIGLADYFYLNVENSSLLNLRVTAKQLRGNASLVLLAKKGSQPFDVNFTYYDVRDSQSTDGYGDMHIITLNHRTLTPGVWYFAVVNSADSSETLEYQIEAFESETLACETGLSIDGIEKECSGQGTCQSSLGTCLCSPGFTGLDCSALGIPHLGTGGLSLSNPPIPVGKWAYWSFALPCKGSPFTINLIANTSSNPGAAPLLVVRHYTLPQQVDGTYTLADYYNGQKVHILPQAIALTDCIAGKCVVNPLYDEKMNVIGTAQNIGWEVIPSGIYYIGVYNDRVLGKAPLVDYSVRVRIDACAGHCGDGFVGIDCEELCPGMLPLQGTVQGLPCSGRGRCTTTSRSTVDNYYARCICESSVAGPTCAAECRNAQGVLGCSGNGRCVVDKNGKPYCQCDPNFKGADCSVECPGITLGNKTACNGRGRCVSDEGGVRCSCAPGYGGPACELECPNKCGGVGLCIADSGEEKAVKPRPRAVSGVRCACMPGYVGATCALACPLGLNNASCSGWGNCEEEHGKAVCKCHGCCEDASCSTLRMNSRESDLPMLTVLATVAACLFCLGLVIAVGVLTWRKRRGQFVHFVPHKRGIQVGASPPPNSHIPITDMAAATSTTNLWRSDNRTGERPIPPECKHDPEDPEATRALRDCVAETDSLPSIVRGPEEQSVSFRLESLK